MKRPGVRQITLRFYADNPYHEVVLRFLESLSQDGRGTRNVQAILEPAIIDLAKSMMKMRSEESRPVISQPPVPTSPETAPKVTQEPPKSSPDALFPSEGRRTEPPEETLLQKVASRIDFG